MSRIHQQLGALLLAAVLLTAGCTSKPPAPPTPPPADSGGGTTPPVPVKDDGPPKNLGEGCKEPPGADGRPIGWLRPGILVQTGFCEGAAPLEAFYVNFQLPATLDEAAARNAVHVEGATPTRIDVLRNGTSIGVHLPAGQKGDRLTVRLAGPFGSGGEDWELGFHLWRAESPHITAEIKPAGGDWQPVAPGATLPSGPLALRFRLFGQMNRDLVADQVRALFAPGKDDPARIALEVKPEGDDTLVATLPSAPPRVQIYLSGSRGQYGLDAIPLYFNVYTGEPPHLVSLDPVTGRETALGEAPADVWGGATSSPDFKWTSFTAIPGGIQSSLDVWLVDAQSGTPYKTSLTPSWGTRLYLWRAGQLVVPARKVQTLELATRAVTTAPTAAQLWTNASPNQRYLAGFDQHTDREDYQTWLAPTTVVIHDLETHKEVVLKDLIHNAVHHSEAPSTMLAVWSEDSKTLYVGDLQRKSIQENPTARWLAIDVATGAVSDHPGPPVKKTPAPGPVTGPTGWVYEQTSDWGMIHLHGPDGTTRDAGEGIGLGWRPDGQLLIIRWANGRYATWPGI